MHARSFCVRRVLRFDFLLLGFGFSWSSAAFGAAPPARDDARDVGCGKARAAMRAAYAPRFESAVVLDQLPDTDILHHAVEIELFPQTATLTGKCVMTIQSKVDGLSTFTFRLHESLQITAAIMGESTPVEVDTIDFLTRAATLDRAYAFDEILTLEIQYTGQPVSMGFGSIEFGRQNGFGPDIVYTLSEPYYSGTWWPCKDGGHAEPGDNADKATLEMAVIAPAEMTTVSNGLLQGIDELSGDRRRYRYRSDYPLSTYLVCFSSTEYNAWSREYEYPGGVMPVDFYVYPMDDTSSNRAAWDKVLDMLPALATRFGEYPFVDEKYGIYECEFGGGMEHQTMTAQGTFSERVTVHELAHQWWGDEVTCRKWNDIWLNEGFATYSEALWYEIKPGSDGLPALLAAMDSRRPASVDGSVYVYDEDLDDLWRIFNGSLSYRKGAWVLHQLRHIVGDENFWDILAAYRAQYAFSGATTDEFAAVCATVFGEDLSWFFDEWIYDIGAPSYDWSWQAVEILGQHYVRLYIDQTQTNAYPRFTMPIDISVTTASGAVTHVVFNDADSEHFVIPVSDLPTAVAFDPEAWVLWRNRTQVGYVPGPPAVVQTVPAPGDVVTIPGDPFSVFVTFSSDVSAVAGDFSIAGASTGDHPFDFTYDAANFTAQLDLGEMLPIDVYTVTAFDLVTALDSGDALDGELNDPGDSASLPSGDGLPGGDAVYTFSVQSAPGDGDADGDVDLFDFEMLLACTTGPGGDAPPQCAAFDIDQDGDVDFADFGVVQSLFTGPF